jgi:hypothetical protein
MDPEGEKERNILRAKSIMCTRLCCTNGENSFFYTAWRKYKISYEVGKE